MDMTRNSSRLIFSLMLLVLSLTFYSASLYARPDLMPTGDNIADKGSAWYRFTVHSFTSNDGERHYKVWVGIPKTAAPKSGYPVLYLLDGNSVMAHLTEPLLKQMYNGTPPVLVAVGYNTDLPFDVVARSYDYTPPNDSKITEVSMKAGRKGGGSHQFRQLLLSDIVPWVEQLAPSDPARRAIWGHSFGGLFTLDSFYQGKWFKEYFAAAPSLNWNEQRILTLAKSASPQQLQKTSLYLMEGDGVTERRKGHPADLKHLDNQLSAVIRSKGADVHTFQYPGQTHGQIFTSSLMDTLHIMSAD